MNVLGQTPAEVPPSLAFAWAQPAVQRLRHALLHEGTDPDAYLEVELEGVLLDVPWMTDFMSVPFTEESMEGARLAVVLTHLKARFPQRDVVQNFVFRFWNPTRVDTAALMNGSVDFDTAFRDRLSMSEDEAKGWLC
jgi:hypothetical protein